MSGAASGIQTKLTVGAPGDVYEQEADRVAAQVMSMPRAAAAPPQVQRFGVEGSLVGMYSSLAQSITPMVHRRVDEQVQMYSAVQRAFQAGGTQASGDLESRLNASIGGGSALAPEVRAFMEPRFGADFSSVRVHTGSEAVQMNDPLTSPWRTIVRSPGMGWDNPVPESVVSRDNIIAYYDSPGINILLPDAMNPTSRLHSVQNFTGWVVGEPRSGGGVRQLCDVAAWYSVVSLVNPNFDNPDARPAWNRFYGNRSGTGWANTSTPPEF